MANKGHATTPCMLLDNLAGGTLGTHEHDLVFILGEPLHRIQGVIERRHSVLEIDDVNFVPCPEDVSIHLGVPETGLVSKVRTCLQQVTHTYLRHSQTLCLG